jgi:hypothetical protein
MGTSRQLRLFSGVIIAAGIIVFFLMAAHWAVYDPGYSIREQQETWDKALANGLISQEEHDTDLKPRNLGHYTYHWPALYFGAGALFLALLIAALVNHFAAMGDGMQKLLDEKQKGEGNG